MKPSAVSLSSDVTNPTSTVGASRPVLAGTTRQWVEEKKDVSQTVSRTQELPCPFYATPFTGSSK